jgi:hypothetical protein
MDDGVDHASRSLASGRTIEKDSRSSGHDPIEAWELAAHGFDVEIT